MKEIRIILYVLIIMLLTTSCSNLKQTEDTTEQLVAEPDLVPSKYDEVNNLDGVTMVVKGENIVATGITVHFDNRSEKNCIYGEFYVLEMKVDDKWFEVPVVFEGNYGFNAIGYELKQNVTSEWSTDWEWLYGALDEGEYRIVKDILDFRGTGDYDTYILAAEFSVGKKDEK